MLLHNTNRKPSDSAMLKYTPALDKIAVSTSAFCAIHCLCLPVLLGVFPAVGATVFGQESFHVMLLLLVIPFCVIALSLGCREHKDWLVGALGVIGLSVLIAAALFGHDLLGEAGERGATLLGAAAIAAAHIRNYMLCRRTECSV